MIRIYDWEDGLQEFFKSRIILKHDEIIMTGSFDERGIFKFKQPGRKNIIILSKPFDCLQRGVLNGKYSENDQKAIEDWSRRNWRYTSEEVYEHFTNITDAIEDKLFIHPERLNEHKTLKRIETYLTCKFDFDVEDYDMFFKENINLR